MAENIYNDMKKIMYWVHIFLISLIVLAVLQYFTGGQMLTIKNLFFSTILVGVADIIVHIGYQAFGIKI